MQHRTNLVFDTDLINSLKKATGEDTIRGAFEKAGKFFIDEKKRMQRMQGILKYKGSHIWQGNLRQMRKSRFPSITI